MRMDVARPHFLQDQLIVAALRRPGPEIEHHRHIGCPAAFFGSIHRSPGNVLRVPRHIRPVMSRLYADNDVAILLDCVGAPLRVHLIEALLQFALHPVSDDVEKS